MLNILVVEDHALVREGLTHLLRQLGPDTRVQEAPNGEVAVRCLEDTPELDLIVLDLALPGIDGLSWMKIQRKRFPSIPVVVVSAYDDATTVANVMKAGASGFVPKASPADQLLDALRRVLDGEIVHPTPRANAAYRPTPAPVSDSVVTPSSSSRAAVVELSARQAEVLDLMMKGSSNRDIGQLLGLAEGTVKVHCSAIFKALGVKSRTQALLAAARVRIRVND